MINQSKTEQGPMISSSKSHIDSAVLTFSSEAGLGNPITIGSNVEKGMKYLPYSSSSARYNTVNIYPQKIQELALDSPTNGAAIKLKSRATYGRGFDKTNLSRNLIKVLQNMNKRGQTIDDILKQVAYDYVTFGGFALKVSWTKGGKIGSVERIPFCDVRVGEPDEFGDINYYVVSNNWTGTLDARQARAYSLPSFNPSIFQEVQMIKGKVPVLNEEQLANASQIIYFYPELENAASSGMVYYPVPDYASCLDFILTEVKLGVSIKSMLDNGMGHNTVVNYPFWSENPDEMAEEKRKFISNFTSAKNNGSVIVNFSEDKDSFPEYISLPALPDGIHTETMSIVEKQILKSHGITNPSLLGIEAPGGFSSQAEQMEVAYKIFNRTVISSYQQDIEKVFNTVIFHMGWSVDMQIIPFSILDSEDIVSDEISKESEVSEKTSLDSK